MYFRIKHENFAMIILVDQDNLLADFFCEIGSLQSGWTRCIWQRRSAMHQRTKFVGLLLHLPCFRGVRSRHGPIKPAPARQRSMTVRKD